MQRLLSKHRFTDVDRAMRYLSIRLGSRPETATLQAPINDARQALREAEEKHQQALQARVAATAEIEYLDGRLDDFVMAISRDVLVLTNGDRGDARYLKLFSTAPSVGMAPIASEGQDLYVRNILSRVREDADLEPLRRHVDELAARHAALDAAMEKRRSLSVPEGTADADRRLALDNARRVYNRTEAQLRLVIEDKALIESYFMPLSARSRAVAEDGDAADAEA